MAPSTTFIRDTQDINSQHRKVKTQQQEKWQVLLFTCNIHKRYRSATTVVTAEFVTTRHQMLGTIVFIKGTHKRDTAIKSMTKIQHQT